jgi:hypothetical protein
MRLLTALLLALAATCKAAFGIAEGVAAMLTDGSNQEEGRTKADPLVQGEDENDFEDAPWQSMEQQLVEMGFEQEEADLGAKHGATVQQASSWLLEQVENMDLPPHVVVRLEQPLALRAEATEHIVFTTFKCTEEFAKCGPAREQIEANTRYSWSTLAGNVKFLELTKQHFKVNPFGLPIFASMFLYAMNEYPSALTFTYVNGDILPDARWERTVSTVSHASQSNKLLKPDFMMVGRRCNVLWPPNLSVKAPSFDFKHWLSQGELVRNWAVDYFIVSKNAVDFQNLPDLVIGRNWYDNFMLAHVMSNHAKVDLIDVTDAISVIHQSQAPPGDSRNTTLELAFRKNATVDPDDINWNSILLSHKNMTANMNGRIEAAKSGAFVHTWGAEWEHATGKLRLLRRQTSKGLRMGVMGCLAAQRMRLKEYRESRKQAQARRKGWGSRKYKAQQLKGEEEQKIKLAQSIKYDIRAPTPKSR